MNAETQKAFFVVKPWLYQTFVLMRGMHLGMLARNQYARTCFPCASVQTVQRPIEAQLTLIDLNTFSAFGSVRTLYTSSGL